MKLFVFFLLILAPIIASQDLKDLKAIIEDQESTPVEESLTEHVVHGPVEDTVYIVGPGDAFNIMLWGFHAKEKIRATVNPEGNLVIPEMGVIKTGKTLKAVKEEIKSLIRKKTKNIKDIVIELYKVKSLLISISGEVPFPGTYTFQSTVRLSDVIAKTFPRTANPLDSVNASLRNVQVISRDGARRSYDFANYLRNGIIEDNPYIFSGQRIVVPYKSKKVIITGAVVQQGYYDYRKESLYDLIQFCGGNRPGADTNNIQVTGFNEDGYSLHSVILSYPEACKNYTVQNDDYIVVGHIPGWHEQISTRIFGRIRNPGTYNLEKGATVLDLIDKGGGILEDGDMNISYLRRDNYLNNSLHEDRGFSEILTKTYLANVNKLNIDFNKILLKSADKAETVLQDNDIVFIPKKTNSVSIVGCVANPGLVRYNKGEAWKYYVKMAGGFDHRALRRQTLVYRASRGAWIAARNVDEIHAGDIIYVKAKPFNYTRNLIKDVFSIIGGLTAAITTVVWIYIAVTT